MRFQKCLAALLASVLALPAQQTTTAAKPADSGGLKIVVVSGEGAKNSIRSRMATAPVVEVRDAADKPVAGAEVVFQLPPAGPGGNFSGWLKMQTVKTDETGRAKASDYTPNDEEGRFNIKVVASTAQQTASLVIAQSNVRGTNGSGAAASRPGWYKWAAILGGAAIAGGVVAATRGDSNGSNGVTTRPITIGAGAVTVGGPR